MSIPTNQLLIAETGLAAFSGRVPEHVRNKVEVRFRREGQSFILFEWRARLLAPEEWAESPVAKFTYVAKTGKWRLYRMDRNLRWRGYEPMAGPKDIETLLKEVDEDPCALFWG